MFKLDGNGQLSVEDFKDRTSGRYTYSFSAFHYLGVFITAEFYWRMSGKFICKSVRIYREEDKFKAILPYGEYYENSKLRNVGERYGEYYEQKHELWFDTVEDLNFTFSEFIEELSKM